MNKERYKNQETHCPMPPMVEPRAEEILSAPAPQKEESDVQLLLADARFDRELFDKVCDGVYNGNDMAVCMMQSLLEAKKKKSGKEGK